MHLMIKGRDSEEKYCSPPVSCQVTAPVSSELRPLTAEFVMCFTGYLIAWLTFIRIGYASDFCSADIQGNCGLENESRNKYAEGHEQRYSLYLEAIHSANNVVEESTEDCTSHKNCELYVDIIEADLKPFRETGISRVLIEAAKARGTYYQIINGKLYREKECMFPSRCAGIEHFIISLIGDLPNMDLVMNIKDHPQSSKHFGKPLPVFSFSKTQEYYDITYPAWSFWEGGPAISLYPRGLGRWDLHRKSLNEASKKRPWKAKEDRAFFRGSRTSNERDNLVMLSRRRPDLVEARYTKNQAWKSEADTLYKPPADEISLESHCDYKYLFNFRGVAASFRHKHLFLCRSLVFHVGNQWTEFYYGAMKPWLHFIPVPTDATQEHLEELILFARKNDAVARKIANQGRDFIWNHLRMENVTHFWKSLLQRYGELLAYKPVLDKTLIEIRGK
ncbi:O-glucosyltransferase rumi homolog [Athalia rosae]|uniref:O-glucosyltransferase rumi homolog n=1 Tax=Athalia rosae TaxID=37344 RepID=UPI0020339EE0|nr:O-glucosyltransferase rumi homolog [Athalia rosae]